MGDFLSEYCFIHIDIDCVAWKNIQNILSNKKSLESFFQFLSNHFTFYFPRVSATMKDMLKDIQIPLSYSARALDCGYVFSTVDMTTS